MSDDQKDDVVTVACDGCGVEAEVAEPQEAPAGWYYATIQIRDEEGEADTADEAEGEDEEEVDEVRIFACSPKCRDGLWAQEPRKTKRVKS